MTADGQSAPAVPAAGAAGNETLLAADEPAAVEIVNAGGGGRAVLVCDHASNRLPRRLGTLGLRAADLADHIAWDPGAAEVARRLSVLLDAPLILSGYSRLAVDCNRPPGSADSMPVESGGVAVPGNRRLTAAARASRLAALFEPYHLAIAGVLDRRAKRATVLLSMHSFTPVLLGERRPWQVSFSHGRDRRLAALMLAAMRQGADFAVGDNQPYSVDDATDYTIPVHGERRGIAHVLIEIRQDGLTTTAGAGAWAERLAVAYRRVEAAALAR